MARRMLIDATHPEETRVVVVSGNKVEEFDYETANKTQLKGNIYLAKVTRVEPSLQAAFVEYGGNRHGFLPFSEIHPDYYRIPIEDREALLAEEAKLRRDAHAGNGEDDGTGNGDDETLDTALDRAEGQDVPEEPNGNGNGNGGGEANGDDEAAAHAHVEEVITESTVDTLGDDDDNDNQRRRAALMRRYKIQEVIKRRQVMLVQVTKEERGNKGAALTTYLSLAGRYCVLMPNTAKGGGISRKISNATDRRRLKKIVSELEIPEGMAVIVRTAGSQRTKAEIRRDYDYLLRLWDEIRTRTLDSTAPDLIYEEANLIKRAIRDLYTREMDEVLVEGDEGYKAAKSFMKMLMPSHARKVKAYTDARTPLFHRFKVEDQLEAMHQPKVELKSGGSIVLAPTEALVSIDVNSGKATRERHIEETALKTNLEAADEVARQLRLRDLAGLVVIDFIDMEEPRHNREVERRLKEAMRNDRARIQLGRISPFGLLELSRQRLRPSLFESVNEPCPTCHGSGHIRSGHSLAMEVLRAIADEGVKRGGGAVEVKAPVSVALHLLNEKRQRVLEMEQRFGLEVLVRADDGLGPVAYNLRRLSTEAGHEDEEPEERQAAPVVEKESRAEEERHEDSEGERRRRRGRRGGRRRRRDGSEERESAAEAEEFAGEHEAESEATDYEAADREAADHEAGERESAEQQAGDEERRAKRRRRGKRGGRRRGRSREDGQPMDGAEAHGAGDEDTGLASDDGADESDAVSPEAPAEVQAQAEPVTAAEAPVEAPVEVPAEAPAKAVAETEAVAENTEPAPEEKPKPKRRSRARKKPEAAAKAEAEAPAEEAPAETAAPAEEEAPAKPARRRTRRPRKTEAESAEAVKPEAETAAPEAAQPETPVAAPEVSAAPATNGTLEPQGTPEAETEAEESRAPEPATADAGDDATRPRRRGWWNRLLE